MSDRIAIGPDEYLSLVLKKAAREKVSSWRLEPRPGGRLALIETVHFPDWEGDETQPAHAAFDGDLVRVILPKNQMAEVLSIASDFARRAFSNGRKKGRCESSEASVE